MGIIMFEKEIYIERRKTLSMNVNSGVILLLGNEDNPINYADNTFRFRQDSTFLYYIGISLPNLAATIDVETGDVTLYGNNPGIDSIVWTGKVPSLEELANLSGIKRIHTINSLKEYLSIMQRKRQKIHFLPPYRSDTKIKLSQILGISLEETEEHFSIALITSIVSQREIKSEIEIAEIEKAVNISIDMHTTAIKMVKPGMLEHEIAAEVNRIPLSCGAEIAFPIIATINGQTLHNHYHGNVINEGDLFLLDAGAELPSGYCGDLSSTFPVANRFSNMQKEIYDLAIKAHYAAVEHLAPGISFRDVHFKACYTIVDGLKDLGLMKGDTAEAVEAGAHALFFPCGTGHMMGLDVHDMENLGEIWVGYDGKPKSTQFGLKSLRLAKALKPGFVFTIEPGIYFIPDLIDLWRTSKTNEQFLNFENIEKYRNFGGIRNEENYLITIDGSRVLGRSFSKSVEEIEKLRG